MFLLWLIPGIPLFAFLLLAVAGGKMQRNVIGATSVASAGFSAFFAILIGLTFSLYPPEEGVYSQILWTWFTVGEFSPKIMLHLDALSVVMSVVITVVAFLIFLYASKYMEEDEGYRRFFAYMNLFLASMLILILAGDLLLLYLGWEGVGLCSYLLIGHWYRQSENGAAARKAFLVTRIGDTAMVIGLFLFAFSFETLHIQTVLSEAQALWGISSSLAVAAAILMLIGALGKSAQLPLQVWLPDAMAGPTPVSALIHAATMVTAGVYLIARLHPLFLLAPSVLTAVAVIGMLTLLIAGCSALTQSDLKRCLAYSTISQIGYMFLALGVSAWSAAIFHFMTHAFFKALLFLAAGVVIHATHENNMFNMGGLRRKLPVVYWTFLIGASALAAFPLVTAGFYSKDLILWQAYSLPSGSVWLWLGGYVGALVTSLYSYRMVFLVFWGQEKTEITPSPVDISLRIPLIVLAVFSIFSGFVELPQTLGGFHSFSRFVRNVFPHQEAAHAALSMEIVIQGLGILITLLGLVVAYWMYALPAKPAEFAPRSPMLRHIHRIWNLGWGFDYMYTILFVQPFRWLAHANRGDLVDQIPHAIAWSNLALHESLKLTQNGRLRYYAMWIAAGVVLCIVVGVFL